jgi:hypothetical protein
MGRVAPTGRARRRAVVGHQAPQAGSDLPGQIETLRLREISEEVASSRHGRQLREYREVVWRSLETQNVVAGGMGVAGPDWQALVDRGIDVWDEFGCERQMLTPAPWMPECDELEELRYQVRETCLTLEEREERRREHEEWLEEQQRSARATDG